MNQQRSLWQTSFPSIFAGFFAIDAIGKRLRNVREEALKSSCKTKTFRSNFWSVLKSKMHPKWKSNGINFLDFLRL